MLIIHNISTPSSSQHSSVASRTVFSSHTQNGKKLNQYFVAVYCMVFIYMNMMYITHNIMYIISIYMFHYAIRQ